MTHKKHYNETVTTPTTLSDTQPADSHGLHHDHIADEAIGGHTADLGKSYYTSLNFIGTVIVSLL